MSLTLAATQSVAGSAGSAGAITYTIFGDEISGSPLVDNWKVLAQGQLPVSPASLYSTPAATQTLIKRVLLVNTTAGALACAIFINGTAATNKAVGMTLPANGSAEWTENGWAVLDALGNRQTTGSTGPQGPKGMTFRGAYSGATAYAVDDVVRDQSSSWIALVSTTGNAPPTLPTASNTQWSLVAQKGDQGIQGTTGNTGTPGTNGVINTINTTAPLTGGGSAASLTLAIAADGVTNTLLAQMAASTIKGNNTGGAAGPSDLTAAQVAAMLPVATISAAGTMSAAQARKLSGISYDIRDFGALDDGSDCKAAIEAAASAAGAAGGGIVFIPEGLWTINSTVTIDEAFVEIRGVSRVASQFRVNFTTGDAFSVTGIFVFFQDVRIQGAANNRTSGFAINFTATASNCGCFRVDVIYNWSGIKATGQLCRLENMNIRETGAAAANGQHVLIDSFTDQVINGVVCDNPTNPTGFAGLRITNLSSLILTNCHFIHSTNCIDVVPTGTNTIPSIFATNVFFDNGVIGANFEGAVGSTIARCKFTQCWFSSHSTFGVKINNANVLALDFINCDIYGSPVGVEALQAQDWSLRNSRVSGNSTAGVRTTAGAAHSFTVSDNFIGNGSGFGANGTGIVIQAGTYKRYQVLDNRGLESNTTPGISDLGTVGATDTKTVANNMGVLLSGAMATLATGVTTGAVAAQTLMIACRIPANAVVPGSTFRITLVGSNALTGIPTFQIRIGTTGTVAGDTVIAASVAPATGVGIMFDGLVTIRSIGAGGTLIAGARAQAGAAQNTTNQSATVAVNTTAAWFITVSCAMSASTFVAQSGSIRVE